MRGQRAALGSSWRTPTFVVLLRYVFVSCPLGSFSDSTQFSTLGGLLFGYDQGVVSGVITMESFAARFPRIFSDSGFKGWFVSTLLLGK
jgi:hypothetical protein